MILWLSWLAAAAAVAVGCHLKMETAVNMDMGLLLCVPEQHRYDGAQKY